MTGPQNKTSLRNKRRDEKFRGTTLISVKIRTLNSV